MWWTHKRAVRANRLLNSEQAALRKRLRSLLSQELGKSEQHMLSALGWQRVSVTRAVAEEWPERRLITEGPGDHGKGLDLQAVGIHWRGLGRYDQISFLVNDDRGCHMETRERARISILGPGDGGLSWREVDRYQSYFSSCMDQT